MTDEARRDGAVATAAMVRRRDLFWAYGAQLLNVGAGIVLLPVTLRHLSADEMGLWYLFIALAALAQLLEFGFQPTIARQSAYVYAGAGTLQAHGLPTAPTAGASLDPTLLAGLFFSARRIYRLLSLGAATVLFVAGSAYLLWLPNSHLQPADVVLPWLLYAGGAVVTFGTGYYGGFLQGRGEVATASKSLALSKTLMLAASVPLLVGGYGLLGLGVSNLVAALLYRLVTRRLFLRRDRPETVFILRRPGSASPGLTTLLWKSAWRLGVVQLGAFLILRANLFIASVHFDLRTVAAYGLTLQLAGLLTTLATMLTSLLVPRMSALQAQGRTEELRTVFSSALLGAVLFYLAGAGAILAFGPPLLRSLGSHTTLLAPPLLSLLLLVLFLELIHSVSATYLTTLNTVPFVNAALLSGAAIVLLGVALTAYSALGLASLVLSQGIVQLAYNNWKWPREAARHLRLGLLDVLRLGAAGLLRTARAQ